jgi:hypothetical protein
VRALAERLHLPAIMMTSSRLLVADPDGVPHEIIGITLFVSFLLAASCFVALAAGGAASVLALLVAPVGVLAIERRSRQQRSRQHARRK